MVTSRMRPPSGRFARLLRAAALAAVFGCLVHALPAQSARWQPDRGSLGVGQVSEIQLVFEGCSPDGSPSLPAVPGLAVEFAGSSQSTEIVNFNVTRRVLLTYRLRAAQRGRVQIPPFDVRTDKGNVRVPAATFEVGDATVGSTGASLESIVQSRLVAPPQPVWAGEVFPFAYTLSLARRYSPQLASNVEWDASPLSAEEWSKPEMAEAMRGGEPRVDVTYRTRALARTPGAISLKPAQQLVNLQTGTSTFGLFARPTLEQFTITTAPASLIVKPLPSAAPAGFAGAVGDFTLESKVVPESAAVGEPVTWTLRLAGTGNWSDIGGLPSREVSRDFRVVQPQPKRTLREGSLFDGELTEDVVLIPTKPGTYTLGPVAWVHFDPKTGTYRPVTTPATTVTITPAAAPAPSAASAEPGEAARTGAGVRPGGVDGSRPLPASPDGPQPIPRDPLPVGSEVGTPLERAALLAAALAALGLVLLTWLGLSARRAWIGDPHRPRREARARLQRLLHTLSQAQRIERAHLLSWQRESAAMLGLRRAVPLAHELAAAAEGPERAGRWTGLWEEAERAIYSPDTALPADWTTRAIVAFQATPAPRFPLPSIVHPRHLLPFVALAVLAAAPPARGAGTDGADAYSKGDFTAAEKAWRQRVMTAPTDWAARHNLALALGQQDRWAEAAAHATAAFVQNPGHASVRWHLRLAFIGAAATPAEVAPFLGGSLPHRVAGRLSPTHWTWVLLAAAGLGALSLILLLLRAYGGPRRVLGVGAIVAGAAGLLAAPTATLALHLYGPLAGSDAVMVWRETALRSVPTEAAEDQKSSTLRAGTIAIVDKRFLGWRRLRFDSGQTGWAIATELVPLWRAPVAPR